MFHWLIAKLRNGWAWECSAWHVQSTPFRNSIVGKLSRGSGWPARLASCSMVWCLDVFLKGFGRLSVHELKYAVGSGVERQVDARSQLLRMLLIGYHHLPTHNSLSIQIISLGWPPLYRDPVYVRFPPSHSVPASTRYCVLVITGCGEALWFKPLGKVLDTMMNVKLFEFRVNVWGRDHIFVAGIALWALQPTLPG